MFFTILILSFLFSVILSSTNECENIESRDGFSIYEGMQYCFIIKAKQHQTIKMRIKNDNRYSPFNKDNIYIYEKDENDNMLHSESGLGLSYHEIDGLYFVYENYTVQYNETDLVLFNFTSNRTTMIDIKFYVGGQSFDLINGTKSKFYKLNSYYTHYFFIKAKEGNYFNISLSFTVKDDYNNIYQEYHYYLYEKRTDKNYNNTASIEPYILIKDGTYNYNLIFYRKINSDKKIDINYISFTLYFSINIDIEIKIDIFDENKEEEKNEYNIISVIVFIFCIVIAVILIYIIIRIIRRKKSLKDNKILENQNPAPLMDECFISKPIKDDDETQNVTPSQ